MPKFRMRTLLGLDILVSITYADPEGHVLRLDQFHGEIEKIRKETLVVRRYDDQETTWIRRELDAIWPAPRGKFKLAQNGSIIIDPTLFTAWVYTVCEEEESGETYYEVEPIYSLLSQSRFPKPWEFTPNAADRARTAWIIETFSPRYLGRRILVGITDYANDGHFLGQRQFVGHISSISEGGIVVESDPGGEPFGLPPDLGLIERAQPGEYRLRSDGRIVNNPDFLATFALTHPD